MSEVVHCCEMVNNAVRAFVTKALDDPNGITSEAKGNLKTLLEVTGNQDILEVLLREHEGRIFIPEEWQAILASSDGE